MKVLYAQEFGAGLGHLTQLLAIAAELQECEPVFAIPSVSLSLPLIRATLGDRFEARLAPEPTFPGINRTDDDPTLADALERMGYNQLPCVMARAEGWQALIDDIRPDLIVCDFAPTLQLIDRRGAPLVSVGYWYTIPPADRELPSLKRWQPYVPPASRRREREMLAVANAARRKRSLPMLDYFADLFHGDRTFLTAFEGFDAYRSHRSEPPLQPFNNPDMRPGPDFAARRGPLIFCYLYAALPGLNQILTALNGFAAPIEVFVRDIDPRVVAAQVAPQIAVHPGPADYKQVLPQASLFIHYGAASSAYTGLLAGVPQLMAPVTMEHQANAYGVQELGCGLWAALAPDAAPEQMRDIFAKMLADRAMQQKTLDVAHELAATRRPGAKQVIVAACRELLGLRLERGGQ